MMFFNYFLVDVTDFLNYKRVRIDEDTEIDLFSEINHKKGFILFQTVQDESYLFHQYPGS